MNFEKIMPYYKIFLSGFKMTCIIMIFSIMLSLIMALILNILWSTKKRWVMNICNIYVLIIRSTPLLLLLFLCHFGTAALFSIRPNPVISGIVGLSISASAYMAESIRGGFLGVDKGQKEAATALGIKGRTIFMQITFPQALRHVLPSLLNDSVLLIKTSTLLGQIGVSELFLSSQKVSKASYAIFESYIACGIIFYILILIIGKVAKRLERRVNCGG